MTMWCSPNPRNDFAEIILAHASSSGGAFPSKRQWQMPPSSAITVEVTATDSHRLPSRPLQRDPFRATAKPTISNFQAVPSGSFYFTINYRQKQFHFCGPAENFAQRPCAPGRAGAGSFDGPWESFRRAALSPKQKKRPCGLFL